MSVARTKRRLAIVVSHPIQYFVPLYQRLAQRDDLATRVFYTWHAGEKPVEDRGFRQSVAWDIPLTEGYEFEPVPNTARDDGTHRFLGLRNPNLLRRIAAWHPDVVVVHGWAWLSHLQALHGLHRRGIRTLFRGDSHLLDETFSGLRWSLKRRLLQHLFSWPAGFLVVGAANRAYYERFGVPAEKLYPCPHSIDVGRFAEPAPALEQEAAAWRRRLGIAADRTVLLSAGKFEPKKRPVELMRIVERIADPRVMLVLAGAGELQGEIDAIAAANPARFRVLPFQNQSRMGVVYRLGDLFVLPSAYGETWGIAVNEALACGRPVLLSNRVGCAADLVDAACGRVFHWNDMAAWQRNLEEMAGNTGKLLQMRAAAARRAQAFDITETEAGLAAAVEAVCAP